MAVDAVKTIPNKTSSGSQWIEWHKALKDNFGKKQANSLFLMAWQKRHADGGALSILTGNQANTVELRNYLQKQGITISGEGALDYSADFIDDAENIFSGIFGTAKTAGIIITVVIAIPILILLFNIAREPRLLIDGFKAYTGRG